MTHVSHTFAESQREAIGLGSTTMRTKTVFVLLAAVGVFVGVFELTRGFESVGGECSVAVAGETTASESIPRAVETSLHEFMEYVFEPPYKRLRELLAAEPAETRAWKAVKSDSLILAEAENLLLLRLPAEGANAWSRDAVATRDSGSQLYQAARAKDYPSARQSYLGMLDRCNTCHKHFAEGKHQLKP